MHYCVLMGSPKKEGHTMGVLRPFLEELQKEGHTWELIWLYDREIHPCLACRVCQDVQSAFGCVQQDDMEKIAAGILAADVFVLATPIYAWFCTAPMKAMLDRLVYGMNKYYGTKRYGSLWKGKSCALLLTGGYPEEKSAVLFEEGMKGYCRHSGLLYQGHVFVRDFGYHTEFLTPEKMEQTRAFARLLMKQMEQMD